VREGRNTETGEQEARPRANVVRLPRDWLGPREELVPFGPSASSEGTEELPPSAEDFWGERSAAIHDALEAPADISGAPVGVQARRRFDRKPRPVALGVLAIAFLAALAVVSTVFGTDGGHRPTGGPRVAVAAVFAGGLSRLLQLAITNLDASVPRNLGTHASTKSVRPNPVSRTAHRAPAPRLSHRVHPQLSSAPPVSIDATRATTTTPSTSAETNHVDTTPTYRSAPPSPPSRPAASATVSPTGQSGALGPIQSPNG
jgi:hypothetical protein